MGSNPGENSRIFFVREKVEGEFKEEEDVKQILVRLCQGTDRDLFHSEITSSNPDQLIKFVGGRKYRLLIILLIAIWYFDWFQGGECMHPNYKCYNVANEKEMS